MINTASVFLKNVGFNVVADLSTKLANSILILLLSHYLGVTDMGSYSVAHTFFTFGLLISYWGFGTLLTREIARNRDSYSKYLSNFSITRVLFAAVIIALINLIVPYLGYNEQTQTAIRIISLGIIANTVVNLLFALFIAFEQLNYLSIIALSVSVFRIVGSFVILNSGGSVISVAIFTTITEFISLAISLIIASQLMKGFEFNFDKNFCVNQIVKAFPFFWIAILVIVDTRVEILIISLLLDESFVGYYTAMNTIIGGLALFSEGVRNAIFPIFARLQIHSKDRLKEMVLILGKYILLITIPITIGVFFLADEIIGLLFGSGFNISVTLLQIIVWTFIGHSLKVVYIRLLMVHDKEKLLALSLLMSAILTVILNVIFIPSVGLIGVAFIRLLTTYVLLFLIMYFVSKQNYKLFETSILIRIIAASSIQLLSTIYLHAWLPYLGIIIGLLIFASSIWLTHVINPKDIRLWNDVVRNILNRPATE